jgi:hypothetical protein
MGNVVLAGAIVKIQQRLFAQHAQSLQRAAHMRSRFKSHTEFGEACLKMIASQLSEKMSSQIFLTLHKTFLPPKKRKSPADKIRGAYFFLISESVHLDHVNVHVHLQHQLQLVLLACHRQLLQL